MNHKTKQYVPSVYTRVDFERMGLDELWGFYFLVKMNALPTPFDDEDYTNILVEVRKLQNCELIDFLVEQKINK